MDEDISQMKMILVFEDHLNMLERSHKLLLALEAGGVDNWEGYHHATKEFYREELGEDEDD